MNINLKGINLFGFSVVKAKSLTKFCKVIQSTISYLENINSVLEIENKYFKKENKILEEQDDVYLNKIISFYNENEKYKGIIKRFKDILPDTVKEIRESGIQEMLLNLEAQGYGFK